MKPDVKSAVDKLAKQGWGAQGNKIAKLYVFKNFGDAMAFMGRMAPEIDARDHHPEWTNIYNKIAVSLTTHDAGGVTLKDVELAGVMDKIAADFAKG